MPDFTLGIEEEFQIIDPVTRDLRSHITEMMDEGRMLLGEQVKPEMHQSMIEVGTGICASRSAMPTCTCIPKINSDSASTCISSISAA